MSATRIFDFQEELRASKSLDVDRRVRDVLIRLPGAAKVTEASKTNDKLGVDYWVELPGRHIGVDVKVRKTDFSKRPGGVLDLALETWSVVEARTVGWARNQDKLCDYILWIWLDSERNCLLPFLPLCHAMRCNWEQWRKSFKVESQPNNGYTSEMVLVPYSEIKSAMESFYFESGQPYYGDF